MIEILKRFFSRKQNDTAVKEEEPEKEPIKIVDPYFKERGQRLAIIRQQLNLSQKEFAEKLDFEEKYIKSHELGYKDKLFCSDLLYGLLTKFNVNPDFFLAGVGDMFLKREDALILEKACANHGFTLLMITLINLLPLVRYHLLSHFSCFGMANGSIIVAGLNDINPNNNKASSNSCNPQ